MARTRILVRFGLWRSALARFCRDDAGGLQLSGMLSRPGAQFGSGGGSSPPTAFWSHPFFDAAFFVP